MGPQQRCVHILDNSQSFTLFMLPRPLANRPVSPDFEAERGRVQTQGVRVRAAANEADERRRMLRDAQDAKRPQVHEFSRIQSEYASYKSVSDAAKTIQSTTNGLRRIRPPTAPASDLEKERREISDVAKKNMFFVQVALVLVVVALLGYLALPVDYAHGIAFLLLCVGIAVGFFLRRG
jgi:hypothetical protein